MAEAKKKTQKAAAPKAPKAEKREKPVQTAPAQRIRKEALGIVVSDKMQKTIVVRVDRQVRDGMYGKYLTRSRNFKAHDEKNEAHTGDLVRIIETRPLSRDKNWALKEVIRRSKLSEAGVSEQEGV